MEIVAEFSQVKDVDDVGLGVSFSVGPIYELLLCPACDGVILQRQLWHELFVGDGECESPFETLHPVNPRLPQGMPDAISKAYDAARQVRSIDANAFAVLIRRMLEMICRDRKATGRDLHAQLADLAGKGEIPDKLVRVADGLRNFGNVGAHAYLGELTDAESPILDDLARAIVEYVYSAPHLAERAQARLDELKLRREKSSSS